MDKFVYKLAQYYSLLQLVIPYLAGLFNSLVKNSQIIRSYLV